MFLTICYAAATWMQSCKIKSISTILSKQLNGSLSVSFYNAGSTSNANFTNLVSSDVCINHAKARVVDLMWSQDDLRGVAIWPEQIIWSNSWMSFPQSPCLIPIDLKGEHPSFELDEKNIVHLILETELVPSLTVMRSDSTAITVENYGIPLAWKVDSCLAILLKSDLRLLTDLVMASFMQNNLVINDFLPLIRIETVSIKGTPQPFEKLKNHSRKEFFARSKRQLKSDEWTSHFNGLRSLSILSSQASEFEFKKYLTEGKTGISKPDLIPARSFDMNRTSDCITPTDEKPTSTSPDHLQTIESPGRALPVLIPEKERTLNSSFNLDISRARTPREVSPKLSPRVSPKVSPRTSPLRLVLETDAEHKADNGIEGQREINAIQQNDENVRENAAPRRDSVQSSNPKSAPSEKLSALLSPPGSSKGGLIEAKPPNVLVYSDSNVTRKNVLTTLKALLNRDKYTIYELSPAVAQNGIWMENTTLLVVCGSVSRTIGSLFAEYFLRGGKMLCICSDVLHVVLPTYRTAEVRENELVQFSYGQWQKIKLMHHIFCYQPSPIKKHFSTDSDDPPPTIRKPSIDVQDLLGVIHRLEVKVLGTEETWNTPSLMVASNPKTGGVAVFSQVHLEADPNLYEDDEVKFVVLKESNQARLDILANLLITLGIDANISMNGNIEPEYTCAFFLGRHEEKFEVLSGLAQQFGTYKSVKSGKLTMQFIGKNEEPTEKPSQTTLPILIHACPDDFSTVNYYDTLKTDKIGRLVIYAPVMSSTMDAVNNLNIHNGLTVIARKQINSVGRSNNKWISVDGSALFTLQLHIPMASALGQRLPLLQNLASIATVRAVTNIPGYQNINIGLKWPNDIYANGNRKIGGLMVTTTVSGPNAICNIGIGINLNNSNPTTCINDLIREYNAANNTQLSVIKYERFFALIFNEIEQLLNIVQANNNLEHFYEQYYSLWLHSDAEVSIEDCDGNKKKAKILGIDEFGYLRVQEPDKEPEVVHPNGNSFDMLRGLIFPK